MGEYLDQVSESVRDHLKQLVKTAGLEDTEESAELLAQGWLEKERSFEEQVSSRGMEDADSLQRDEPKGALVMTYSGSLISIGPLVDDVRRVDYASIGLRRDVPETASSEESVLEENVELDEGIAFASGPIKRSSPVYKIAVVKEEMEAEEEIELLREVTQLLADEFVEVNKTIVVE